MNAITRKLGPLPVWAWAGIIGGTFLAVRLLRGGGGTAKQDATVQMIPTGAPPIDPAPGFLNDLSMRLDRIESSIGDAPTSTVTPPPSGAGPASNVPVWGSLYWQRVWQSLRAAGGQGAVNRFAAQNRRGAETWQDAYKRIYGFPYGTVPAISAKSAGTTAVSSTVTAKSVA